MRTGLTIAGWRLRIRELSLVVTLLCAFITTIAAAQPANAELQAPSPESSSAGFELPEREVTLFDIYLGDKYQGLILVEFDGQTFYIPDPKDLVEQLKGVNSPTAIIPLISGDGPADRTLDGIGSVRFDSNTFRVILNLDASAIFGSSLDLTGRIPDPERKGSLRQDLRFAFSDGIGGEISSSSAFTHRTLLGYGKTFLDYDATLLDDGEYELNRGAATTFAYGLQATGGYLRSQGQRFVGNTDFAGINLQTAEEILANEETLRGSRLDVYVPSRSRVEFFRGGRLLLARVLDFGLQEIDTALFPQGSYNVDIVITEDSGRVTRETRYFTKSGLLAVRDVPVFRASLGQQRDEFDVSGDWFGEAGMRWRALDFLDLEGSYATNEDVGIGTLDITALLGDFILQGSGAYSTDSRTGVGGSLSGTLFGFGFSGSYSETLDPDPDQSQFSTSISDDSNSLDPVQRKQTVIFDQLAVRRRDISMQVSRQVGPVTFDYSLQKNLYADEDEREAYGPGLDWRVWRTADGSQEVRFTLEYLTTESGDTTTGMLSYRRIAAPWTYDLQASSQSSETNDESRLRADLTYDSRTRGGYGTRARLGAEAVTNDDDDSLISSGELESNLKYARLSGFVRDTRFGLEDTTSYGGTIDSSLLTSGDLKLSLARPPEEDALLIASVTSSSSSAIISLIVNGQTVEKLTPGTRVVVGLQPFRSYDIAIRQEDREEIVQYEAEPYRVTVFPGNVVEKSWSVERVFIGLGKIVDSSGAPISRSRLRGLAGYVVTEEDGSFQAEIIGGEKVTISTPKGACSITLPTIPEHPQYFHEYGTLVCALLEPGVEEASAR